MVSFIWTADANYAAEREDDRLKKSPHNMRSNYGLFELLNRALQAEIALRRSVYTVAIKRGGWLRVNKLNGTLALLH